MGNKSKLKTPEQWAAAEGNRRRRRADFIRQYESNPANYLPGAALTRIYREAKSPGDVERRAAEWFKNADHDWKAHQFRLNPAMKAASRRWPT